jgi:hypothetical protein
MLILHILAVLCLCWASVLFVIIMEWAAAECREDQMLLDMAHKCYKVNTQMIGVWV